MGAVADLARVRRDLRSARRDVKRLEGERTAARAALSGIRNLARSGWLSPDTVRATFERIGELATAALATEVKDGSNG
jgi:hypothetical protein